MANNAHWRHLRLLYLWHRRLGMAALLLFVILAVSGVMLNHTQSLRLDQRPVTNGWLLAWYGLAPATPERVHRAGDHYLSEIGEQLFLDQRLLSSREDSLVGAVDVDEILLVVTESHLLAYTPDGELIERQALPEPLAGQAIRAGRRGNRLLVAGRTGVLMSLDGELLEWRRETDGNAIRWSQPVTLPEELASALRAAASPLDMERVVLDLHSGRLFGRHGIYLMDAAAGILLLLGLSGGYLWFRQLLRKRLQQGSVSHGAGHRPHVPRGRSPSGPSRR